MQNAADQGRYLKPFAQILLALAARREKQNALAQRLLRELTEEFPSSTLFASEYAKAMGLPIPAKCIRIDFYFCSPACVTLVLGVSRCSKTR